MREVKIYILTAEDPLYSAEIVQALFDTFPEKVLEVAFVSGLVTRKRALMSPFVYGFLNYFLLGVKVIWGELFGGKITHLCKKYNVPIAHYEKVNDGKLLSRLKELGVTLLISINCNKKLKSEVISFPQFGVLNIHNALLPAYRGVMPLVHAVANGEKEVGVTVHFIDESLDTGPIVKQERVTILKEDTLFSLWERCVHIGARLLPQAVEEVVSGNTTLLPNGPEGSSYYSFPTIVQVITYRIALCKRFLLRMRK